MPRHRDVWMLVLLSASALGLVVLALELAGRLAGR
jgi:hypothetical protein